MRLTGKASADPIPPQPIPMVNNNRAPAPPITIMKRVSSTEPTMRSSDMLKTAEQAMQRGDLDTAEHWLDRLEKAKAADDEDLEDDWSEPANAKADGNNASNDDEDDYEDDYEDEDEDDALTKAERFADHVNMTAAVRPSRSARARGYDSQGDTYRTGISPTVTQPKRHKFDSRVEFVQERDQCTRNEAQTRARQEFPSTFADYQNHVARQRTSAQHVLRGGHFIGKRGPTFEDLVSAEIRKGCNMEIASQRVAQAHGFRALDTRMLAKGESIVDRFQKRVDAVMYEEGISAEDAMRKVRRASPHLFRMMQSLG
jgi:hypothetical protein